MKRLGQGRRSALKAMVSLHFPFRRICGVQLPHRKKTVMKQGGGGGWRERFSRRLTDTELFTVPCQPLPILKIVYFSIHLKAMIQGKKKKKKIVQRNIGI